MATLSLGSLILSFSLAAILFLRDLMMAGVMVPMYMRFDGL
jgi:hypothetical protein